MRNLAPIMYNVFTYLLNSSIFSIANLYTCKKETDYLEIKTQAGLFLSFIHCKSVVLGRLRLREGLLSHCHVNNSQLNN